MRGRGIRIGLAGPSCSGKSTLARLLARRLGALHLNLDAYYVKGHALRFVEVDGVAVRSFEHPEAYDGQALVDAARAAAGPVVAEGFLLLGYPSALTAFDRRFFVDLGWDEIRRRRAARPGQTTSKVDRSFDLVGEAEWHRFGAMQAALPGVVVLDGLRPVEGLLDEVLSLATWPAGAGPARGA